MEEMTAYCGITCSECPAFLATRNDDTEGLKRVAEMWSSDDLEIKPDDIICDGCLTGHTRYAVFCSDCAARACAIDKGLENCGHCDDYPCDNLTRVFEMVPEAKAKLDEVRAGLSP